MEANDFLADEMHVRRPVFVEERIVIRTIAQRGNVVGKRVQPDIDHVLRIKVHRNAPFEGRTRHAQILQAGTQEVGKHFRRARGGLNEIRMLFNILNEPVLIFAGFEEIRFLAHALDRTAAVGTDMAFLQLRLRPVRFAGGAVPALVFALVDIALLVELTENLLHDHFMPLIGGADKIAVFNVHQLPQLFEIGDDFVHELLRGNALFSGLAFDLLAVFVRTGQEIGIIAAKLFEACHRIRRDGGIAMTDMRVCGGVINRCCDVKSALVCHCETPPRGQSRNNAII